MLFRLLVTFSLLSQFGWSQSQTLEVGMSINPKLIYSDKVDTNATFGYSVGPFVQYQTNDWLTLGAGVEYLKLRLINFEQYDCSFDIPALCYNLKIQNNHLVRIPLWITMDINSYKEPKVKSGFILGYAYSRIFNKEEDPRLRYNIVKDEINSLFLGLELKKRFHEKYNLSTNLYFELSNSLKDPYGLVTNLNIALRLSQVL